MFLFASLGGSVWFPVQVLYSAMLLAYFSAPKCDMTLKSFHQNFDLWRAFLAKIVDAPLCVMLEVFVWWVVHSPLGLGPFFSLSFKLLVTLYGGYLVNAQIQNRMHCHSFERAAVFSSLLFSSFMFLALEDGVFFWIFAPIYFVYEVSHFQLSCSGKCKPSK
jgi:hypothetical protein